jgi:hypothetical protein
MGRNGGARPGAGRKKGIRNKLLDSAEKVVQWQGITPAEFFQQVMQDTTQDLGVRLEAARAASPYVHRKQPEAHEHSVNVPIAVQIVTPLTK